MTCNGVCMATASRIARVVVCDAGPLIHLDELDSLSLLDDFPSVLVPDAVWVEAERHRPHIFDRLAPSFVRVIPQHPPRLGLTALSRLMPLHAGETQALQIAAEHGADLLLTDDTAARLAARELQLPVHGTLGILLRAIRRGQRSAQEVLELLRAIPGRSTLHIKPSLLLEIVAEVERIAG
jgi:predicted nucleic acid-binding protein